MTELLSIILAAGEGTRMRSATPKVLHQVGGLSIVGHVVNAAMAAGSSRVAVVTGPGHDAVRQMVVKRDCDQSDDQYRPAVGRGTRPLDGHGRLHDIHVPTSQSQSDIKVISHFSGLGQRSLRVPAAIAA